MAWASFDRSNGFESVRVFILLSTKTFLFSLVNMTESLLPFSSSSIYNWVYKFKFSVCIDGLPS